MPKISVLIPLYNRKQYAADCINSVLNQTFQDFEIVIRDDCSNDGVFEFVRENFSDSRIKLFRNKKNLGESENIKLLVKDAIGKYFAILHNDDFYLPDALKKLYETAEKFNADVVHSSSSLNLVDNGNVKNGTPLRRIFLDKYPVKKIEVISKDLNFRFNEWFEGKIFRDIQYNFFNKKFAIDSKIFSDIAAWDLLAVSLRWIMEAKILVKTPEHFYIRRVNQYSQSTTNNKLEFELSKRIEHFRKLNEFINSFEYFRNNEELKYKIKARFFDYYENLNFDTSPSYGDEKFVNLYNLIEDIFRKYFGNDAIYLAMTYHWAHAMHFNQNQFQDKIQECLKLFERNI